MSRLFQPLKSTLAVTLLGAGLVFAPVAPLVSVAVAAAPMAKTQAPGFYRMMLGDFEVTAISDGEWQPTRVSQERLRGFVVCVGNLVRNACLAAGRVRP